MASTSLAQQLQRLAVPQTSLLLKSNKRASLLFEPKDASNLDLETVLEIGLSGLRELQEIGGPEFRSFEESLFDITSVGVERAVLSRDTNDLLDEKINRFLSLLSPYVLLKPAHRALEWLIQRFHIQEYNRDAFIFLWLPYHDTKIFVRALQLVDVSRKTDHWYWLDAARHSGAAIPRNAIINQASTNNAFLAGLCNHVLHSIKVHKSEAGILSSVFAFYCTTVVGAIEGVKKKRKGSLQGAREAQLQVILPCLLKGLSSTIPDFASTSFIIVSSLSRNGHLGLTLLHKIINKIVKNCHCESLFIKEIATLLAVICETQSSTVMNIIPLSALKKLLKNGVAILLVRHLASMAQEIFIDKVSMALLAGILPLTKSSEEMVDDELAPAARKTLNELISTIVLDKNSAKEAIRLFVSALAELIEEEKENKDCDPCYSSWLNGILQNMENKYPSAFDVVVQRMALGKCGDKEVMMTSVLGRLLGLSTLNQEDCRGLMERLCHSEEGVRVAAIRTLAETDIDSLKKKEDLHSLVWVIGQRLQDDSPEVVMAALALPFLNSLIGRVIMTKKLIIILGGAMKRVSASLNSDMWFDVILLSVEMLLSNGLEKDTENEAKDINNLLSQRVKILLSVLPFLCPTSEEEMSVARKVLSLNCSDPMIKVLWKELSGAIDALHFCSSVFDYLLKLHLLAKEEGIHDSDLAEALMACGIETPRNHVVQFMTLISLSGIASCSTTDVKSKILKYSIDLFEKSKVVAALNKDGNSKSYKISAISMGSCLNCAKKGCLPLQALLHNLSAVFFSSESSWFPLDISKDSTWLSIHSIGREDLADQEMQLAVHIFDILVSGCFLNEELSSRGSNNAQHLYISCLKDFFAIHLPELQHQLNFLSCLWVAHEVPVNVESTELIDMKRRVKKACACQPILSRFKTTVMPELQIRSLRLGEALVSKSSSPISWLLEPNGIGAPIVPSLLIACSSPIKCVRASAVRLLSSVMHTVGAHLMTTGGLYVPLVKEMVAQSEEILSDPGQITLFLYVQLSSDPDALTLHSEEKKRQMAKIREALFAILDPKSPAPRHVVRALLQLLYCVRSLDLAKKLSPLGLSLLAEGQLKMSLNEYSTDSLLFIINRLDDSIASSIDDPKEDNSVMWDFFQKALADTQTRLPLTNEVKQFMSVLDSTHSEEICPSILAARQVTKEFFDALPSQNHRTKVLSLLVDVAAQKNVKHPLDDAKKLPLTEAASLAAKSTMKRLTLDADLIIGELSKMLPSEGKDVVPKTTSLISRGNKRVLPVISLKSLQSQPWTRGVTLLEMVQNKKKLKNAHRIIPVLFELLKACLQLKHQEPVEYTKQLILACALHCLRKFAVSDKDDGNDENGHGNIDENQFDVETIVQCIRSTQNPHTHRHALLLLSCAAEFVPDSVLHNVMAIFAFVGTSMVRQDDEYSFEVISRTIESIIPVLVKVGPGIQESNNSRIFRKLPEGLASLEGPSVEGALKVMRVFADAVPDVPPHRRLPLYLKLVETVGWDSGLPQLLLLVIEGQVLHSGARDKEVDKSSGSRVELAYEMARRAPSNAFILCCLRMIQYVRILPADKEPGANGKLLWHPGQATESLCTSLNFIHIFDVKTCTGAQLRHFKHAVLSFLSDILSETQIVAQLSFMDETPQNKEMKNHQPTEKLFQYLIQELLGYIANTAAELDGSSLGNTSSRYWKAIQQRCHQILEKVNALLPAPLFLSVVKGLLSHQLPSIRRKAADILNARLVVLLSESYGTNDSLSQEDKVSLREILSGPLMDMVKIMEGLTDGAENTVTKDNNLNCQVGLLTAKLLIRILGPTETPVTLRPMLVLATKVASTSLKIEGESNHSFGGILASAALCIAEICSVLKVKVLEELHNFMPVLLSALTSQVMDSASTSAVKLGVVTAVQRVVESVPNFLSPYVRPLLVRLCLLASRHVVVDTAEPSKESKSDPVPLRLSSILNKVALALPLRVLIPSVSDAFKILSKKKVESFTPLMPSKSRKRKSQALPPEEERDSLSADGLEEVVCELETLVAIVPLMEMFSHSLSEMSHEELAHHLKELELFFLHALDLRVEMESTDDDVIEKVEASVINALVTLVLKLSEASFRPLYYRLFEWVSQDGAPPMRAVTFYRLSSRFAEALKGLFVLFAGNFIRHAAILLDQNNLARISEIGEKREENAEESSQPIDKKSLFFGEKDSNGLKSHILIKYILSTLHAVFQYDGTGHFITRGRFETLMLPLVNQLENTVGGYAVFQERCASILVPTLVQLAMASADDSLWKQLNYQILLKTRHSDPQVRLAGLSALLELGQRLGEDFLPLLPETVPFLAELMEDEEEEVESATQSALNILSDVLGEPLQKYF